MHPVSRQTAVLRAYTLVVVSGHPLLPLLPLVALVVVGELLIPLLLLMLLQEQVVKLQQLHIPVDPAFWCYSALAAHRMLALSRVL